MAKEKIKISNAAKINIKKQVKYDELEAANTIAKIKEWLRKWT